jgi:ADP-heptose:LPS heptosyltransferase
MNRKSMKRIPLVIQIDGGIGRLLCATPALELLAQKEPERRIIVLTSFPDVFRENPYVYKAYNLNSDYLWEDVIKHGEFKYPEPYHLYDYYTQELHLIQAFNKILIGSTTLSPPKIYLSKTEVRWGLDFVNERKENNGGKPIIVLQHAGAGASIDINNELNDGSFRSLPTDKLHLILDALEDSCTFVNASHIPIEHSKVWNQNFNIRQLFSIIASCDYYFGIDSFASHAAASFGKTGVLLLGSTYKESIGYDNFKVFQREGYPKAYCPNRFSGFIEKQNEGAMDYSDDDIIEITTQTIKSFIVYEK